MMVESNQQKDEARTGAFFRILDANTNRAAEACRVIEDFCRFTLADKRLSETAKQIRHDIRAIANQLAERQNSPPWANRDTDQDVGTHIEVHEKLARNSVTDVVSANFSRLQESLRVLEEYSKILDLDSAARFESVRYETYQIQKTLFHLMRAQELLGDCFLCVLTDAMDSESALAERIVMLISAGVDMIQLRDERLEDRDLLERALLVRKLTAGERTIFVVNDRADICVLANADGVHVGQTDLSVSATRRIVGQKLIGVSTRSLAQAEQAVRDGADYIGVGPMFASQTKQFDQLEGCQLLRQVMSHITLPAFAIGGITTDNIGLIAQDGGRRAAVSAGVLQADDPVSAAKQIRRTLLVANKSKSSG